MVNDKRHILAIGGSGLVGSRIIELLKEEYSLSNYSLETGVDITNASTLSPILEAPEGSIVFHLAAKADVDACEKDKELGHEGAAWKINVLGAENVANACKQKNHTIVYVSTDFVFNGEDTPQGGYSEEDVPHPTGWYATTKYEGERVVQASGAKNIIMRIAYPYRKSFPQKLDFVRAIKNRFDQHLEVKAVSDHIMTPTFIDDIAFALHALIERDATGIYHVVGSSSLSPLDAAEKIAEAFHMSDPHITDVTREVFFEGRTARPFNLTMKNDKITQLGVRMKTFEEGLRVLSTP